MRSPAPLRAAAALVALGPLAAADTLYVGPPGTAPFEEIQDAVDAAAPGDSILVQSGTYLPIVVDRPLRILGYTTTTLKPRIAPDPGAPSSGQIQVRVENLAAGEQVLISGFRVEVADSAPGLLLSNNAGSVILHDVDTSGATNHRSTELESCAYVIVSHSFLTGVSAHDTTVWLVSCTIGAVYSGFPSTGDDAVSLVDSAAYLSRTAALGGKGICTLPNFPTTGGDAIDATRSLVAVSGGPGNILVYGDAASCSWGGQSTDGVAIRLAQGSAAVITSYATVFGPFVTDGNSAYNQPTISYPSMAADQFGVPSFPSPATSVGPGESFFLMLNGHPSGVVGMFLALDFGPPLLFPGINGVFVLDPATVLLTTVTTLPATGLQSLLQQVPASPELVGSTLVYQFVEFSTQLVAASNPVVVPVVP